MLTGFRWPREKHQHQVHVNSGREACRVCTGLIKELGCEIRALFPHRESLSCLEKKLIQPQLCLIHHLSVHPSRVVVGKASKYRVSLGGLVQNKLRRYRLDRSRSRKEHAFTILLVCQTHRFHYPKSGCCTEIRCVILVVSHLISVVIGAGCIQHLG